MIGLAVTNFKKIADIKKEETKGIGNFFKPVAGAPASKKAATKA